MDALLELIHSLIELLLAVGMVLAALVRLLLPWMPLAAWIVFWLFGVNWVKLREVMLGGGWIGVVLIGLVMALAWGVIAPPAESAHYILGLKLSNFVGKIVYVTALFCIMYLCGAVQLSGCCSSCCRFESDEGPEPLPHEMPH